MPAHLCNQTTRIEPRPRVPSGSGAMLLETALLHSTLPVQLTRHTSSSTVSGPLPVTTAGQKSEMATSRQVMWQPPKFIRTQLHTGRASELPAGARKGKAIESLRRCVFGIASRRWINRFQAEVFATLLHGLFTPVDCCELLCHASDVIGPSRVK